MIHPYMLKKVNGNAESVLCTLSKLGVIAKLF